MIAVSKNVAIVVGVLLSLAIVSYAGLSKSPQLAYVVELRLSDEFDYRDVAYNSSASGAYKEFDNGSGVYAISASDGMDARDVVSSCSLSGEYLYASEGLWLSQVDHIEPVGHCGSIRVQLYFEDLNTSGIPFPGNTTNLFIGGIAVEFENHSAWDWPAGGVHLWTSRGIDWNHYIGLTGSSGYGTADFQTGKYFPGTNRDINIHPTAQLLGVDGFAIQSCVWGEMLLKRVWIYVYYNVT